LDLLGRARGFLKGLSTPVVPRVQYYSVVCPQGHRVRGQRTEGYQAIRCPACGEGVFVLPSSPLPEPEPPPRSASRRTATRRPIADDGPLELKDPGEATVDVADPQDGTAGAEIIWEDEVTEPATEQEAAAAVSDLPELPAITPPRRPSRPRPAPADRPPAEAREAPEKRRAAVPPPPAGAGRERTPVATTRPSERQVPEPGARAIASRRRIGRPVLIAAAVVLLVIGSIALRTWRSRQHQLPELASLGRTEGIPALEEGKFDKAYQILATARDAVDALHGDVEGAEEIRHGAEEAGIFVDLLSDSLENLLDDAARTRPQEWATRFDNLYKGRSVIIEATVVTTPDSGGRYELDYVILPPGEGAGERRLARLEVSDLQLLAANKPRAGDRMTFGARLSSFQYDTDREAFVVRFQPESGVTIVHSKALQALGWPSGVLDREQDAGQAEEP
jgi:hypothetical protein